MYWNAIYVIEFEITTSFGLYISKTETMTVFENSITNRNILQTWKYSQVRAHT